MMSSLACQRRLAGEIPLKSKYNVQICAKPDTEFRATIASKSGNHKEQASIRMAAQIQMR
jgi:hypothetical protein